MYTIIGFCLTGIVLIILGILIRECKCYNLIAGYNTMPAQKKKSYNPVPLANKVGILLYCVGIFTVVFGIILHFIEYSKLLTLIITLAYSVLILVVAIIFIAKEAKDLNDI